METAHRGRVCDSPSYRGSFRSSLEDVGCLHGAEIPMLGETGFHLGTSAAGAGVKVLSEYTGPHLSVLPLYSSDDKQAQGTKSTSKA